MPAYRPAEIHPLFAQAFNRGDVDALTALYEPDAVLIVGGNQVIGRENIRNAFESLVANRARMSLETRTVIESSLELAVLHGAWTIEYPPATPSGGSTRGLSTEVVRKQPDGRWLFVIDNPYTPEPPA